MLLVHGEASRMVWIVLVVEQLQSPYRAVVGAP